MATRLRRSMVAAFVVVVAGGALVAGATPAAAQPVESGSLVLTGQPGDWVTQGRSYEFSTGKGDGFTVTASGTNSTVVVSVIGLSGSWWRLTFDAPEERPLTPGATYVASRYPNNGAGPGFELSGEGRGCQFLTAVFTVVGASFGDSGYVESFHATFEQRCDGGPPATGEIHIGNPPPPAPLTVTPAIGSEGTVSPVSGRARVNGEVTCNYPVTVVISGDVSQVVRGRIVRGPLSSEVACTPGAPVPWTAIATPEGNRPFVKGSAEATVQATAFDSTYGRDVVGNATAVTVLSESSPALTDF